MVRYFFKVSLLILLLSCSLACNRGRIYNAEYTFEDYSWSNNEKIEFSPEIKVSGINYQGIIHVRYNTGFPFKYLNFVLILNGPDGSQSQKEISMQLISDDKKYRGSGMGDIWDFDYELSEPLVFKTAGVYHIQIKSLMGEQPVNFINGIGISINKIGNSD